MSEALLRRIYVGMFRAARNLKAKSKRAEHLLRGYSYVRKLVQPPGVANAGLRLCIQLGTAGVAAAVLLLVGLSN
jgi:hypothetical protein